MPGRKSTSSSKGTKPLKPTPYIPPSTILHHLPSPFSHQYWNHHYSNLLHHQQQQQQPTTASSPHPSFEKYLPTDQALILLKEYLPGRQNGAATGANRKSTRKRKAAPRCLYAGCGLSKIGAMLARSDTTLHVEQIDFSSVIVSQLKNALSGGASSQGDGPSNDTAAVPDQEGKSDQQDWMSAPVTTRLMNVLHMSYDDYHFDLVFEKALLDCLLGSQGGESQTIEAVKEIFRVLKPHGYFVSFCNSPNRMHLFEHKSLFHWDLVKKTKIDAFRNQSHFVWMFVYRKWSEARIDKMMEEKSSMEASDVQSLAEELMQGDILL